MASKNTICLWYDGSVKEAARFYARTFAHSEVLAVHRAPGDYPDGKQGDVLTVEFTVLGIACLGLNGGPAFKHTEAFSGQRVRVVQGQVGPAVADHAMRADGRDRRPGSRCRSTTASATSRPPPRWPACGGTGKRRHFCPGLVRVYATCWSSLSAI